MIYQYIYMDVSISNIWYIYNHFMAVSPPFVGGKNRDHQYSWTSHEYAQCILIISTLSYHFCWLIVLIFHELFQLISYLTNIPWIFAFISHSRRNIISSPWYPSLKRRFYMALEHCWLQCCPLGPPGRPGTRAGPFGAHFDGFKRVDSMGNLPSGN